MTISDKKDLKLLLIAAREAQITAEKSVSRVYEKIHSAARGNLIELAVINMTVDSLFKCARVFGARRSVEVNKVASGCAVDFFVNSTH